MEIILIEKVEKLGDVGDLVNVKSGYGRNYLLRQNKALRATDENKEYFESQKKEILAKNEEIKGAAKKVFDKVNNQVVLLVVHASDEGRLFGSIMPKDIADRISESSGVEVKKSQIILAKTIRETGIYEAKVRVHADYLAEVKINVARNEDEAKANLNPKKEAVEEQEVAPAEVVEGEAVAAEAPVEASAE